MTYSLHTRAGNKAVSGFLRLPGQHPFHIYGHVVPRLVALLSTAHQFQRKIPHQMVLTNKNLYVMIFRFTIDQWCPLDVIWDGEKRFHRTEWRVTMQVANGVEMLEISATIVGKIDVIHPTLFWDRDVAILVDTGYPGPMVRNCRTVAESS
jgi:hypothetical protein